MFHWAGSSVGSVGYPGKLVSAYSAFFVSLLLRQKLRKTVIPKLSGKEMMMMKTKALLRRICRYVSSFVLSVLILSVSIHKQELVIITKILRFLCALTVTCTFILVFEMLQL